MRTCLGLLVLCLGCRLAPPPGPASHRLARADLESAQQRRWLQLLASCAPAGDPVDDAEMDGWLDALCAPSVEQREAAYARLLAAGPRAALLLLEGPPGYDPEQAFRLRLLERDLWQVPLPVEVFEPRDLYLQPPALPVGYELALSRPRPQSVDLSLSRDGRPLLTWHGHRQTPVLVRDGVLYTADFERLAPGCAVLAYDLDNRRMLWRKELPGVIRSRRYLEGNTVNLKLETETLTVFRHERRGNRGTAPEVWETPELVVQVLDLSDGSLRFYRELPPPPP